MTTIELWDLTALFDVLSETNKHQNLMRLRSSPYMYSSQSHFQVKYNLLPQIAGRISVGQEGLFIEFCLTVIIFVPHSFNAMI